MGATEKIAIAAILITIIVPLIQTYYERCREWHYSCELLFKNIDLLYEDIIKLASSPIEANHISYQYLITQRKTLLSHYWRRFLFKRANIKKAKEVINELAGVLIHVDYEELLNKGFSDSTKQKNTYLHFVKTIRSFTIRATESLVS